MRKEYTGAIGELLVTSSMSGAVSMASGSSLNSS